MKTLNKELQDKISPSQALDMLKKGNQRFLSNLKVNRNLLQQVNETSDGQHPFAVILSCIDSRTSAELIFDQGLGDIFSVRLAGNVLNEDVLGSMEYACKVAGSKMIVVLGHTKCGAMISACKNVKMGNITLLLEKLKPAVEYTLRQSDQLTIDESFADEVAENNVHLTIDLILERSPILRELVNSGSVGIIGAMYDVESGLVTFYNQDVRMAALQEAEVEG